MGGAVFGGIVLVGGKESPFVGEVIVIEFLEGERWWG